jgi:hypothetical protein
VNHRWQSESTDGTKGGWTCVFEVVAKVAVFTSPQLLDVVWCSAVAVVVVGVAVIVVLWSCSCKCSCNVV